MKKENIQCQCTYTIVYTCLAYTRSTFRLIKTVYDFLIWIYEYISTEVELLCSVTQFVKTNTVFKDTSVIGGID